MATIHEQIVDWANEYVPKFNELSETYKTPFYTLSPLDCIDNEVDLMIIGINPKGNAGMGVRKIEPYENYLKGNSFWSQRFDANGLNAWKFNHGARFFLGYDDFYHPESIDNDQKTVWTNLSPFESKSGSSDLRKELMETGVESTLTLIKIIQPKRIVLLGVNAFKQLSKATGADASIIEYSPVFSNIKAKVGRIYNIPTVCLPHPSGQWEVSNKFISTFVFLHNLVEITNKQGFIRPLKDVVAIMQDEMQKWQKNIMV